MNGKYIIVQITSGALIPILMKFLGDALAQMIPWFIAMTSVVMADLISGLWKCMKLDVPIRFSKACRETMGKMIVYFAFVCMAACINVAEKGEFDWSRWIAVFVVVIEVGSMAGNILKPHGINISLSAIIKAFIRHSWEELSCPEVDEIVEKVPLKELKQQELDKYKEDTKQNGKRRNNKRA